MFRHAIVRLPSSNFAGGLTTVDLGKPDYGLALEQHAAYCDALERCGLALTRLDADPRFPDSTFVEDTAVLVPRLAVLSRPGAPSRAGEVIGIRSPLSEFYGAFGSITSPGTLDGGDVCEADGRFLIGVSARTNEEGARQLSTLLAPEGYESAILDVRSVPGILHLKSGIASLGDGRIAAIAELAEHPALRDYEIIRVESAEAYAANCIRVNDRVLIAAGHPRLEARLARLGCDLISLQMSEFQKMDGGLSCLSLRF